MENSTYFVTSDIHGDKGIIEDLIQKAIQRNVAGMIVAGDLCPQDPAMALLLKNVPFSLQLVRGNCDSLWDYRDFSLPLPPIADTIERADGIRIAFTHGHLLSEPEEVSSALGANDIFVSGHTHVPHLFRDKDGIIHLNPGSPARPRSAQGATYAIIGDEEIQLLSYPSGKVIASLPIRA